MSKVKKSKKENKKEKNKISKSKKQNKKEISKKEEIKPEESKLIEEVIEEEPIAPDAFSKFIRTRSTAPALEKTLTWEQPNISLEQEMKFTQKKGNKKYEEMVKYNVDSEYQEDTKYNPEVSIEQTSQRISASSVDIHKIGRERERIGQEFQFNPQKEYTESNPERYEVSKEGKPKSEKEKTLFQEQLERRYEGIR